MRARNSPLYITHKNVFGAPNFHGKKNKHPKVPDDDGNQEYPS